MKNRRLLTLSMAGIALVFGLMSCIGDFEEYEPFDVYAQYQIDSVIIDTYIAENNLNAYNIDNSGVFISIYHAGTEDVDIYPTRDTDTSTTVQYITAGYKGYLTDGTVFNETADTAYATFALSQVIGGWQLAIPEMSKGDSATILIPSYWGYGNVSNGAIPASSVLMFDIYLESFERK